MKSTAIIKVRCLFNRDTIHPGFYSRPVSIQGRRLFKKILYLDFIDVVDGVIKLHGLGGRLRLLRLRLVVLLVVRLHHVVYAGGGDWWIALGRLRHVIELLAAGAGGPGVVVGMVRDGRHGGWRHRLLLLLLLLLLRDWHRSVGHRRHLETFIGF